MAKKRNNRQREHQAIDQLYQGARLGPLASAVKKRATKQQWHRIVQTAHKQGFYVNDFLDQSVPPELKRRTPSSLRNQAMKTMNDVYAPAEKSLTQREESIKSINDLRARDERHYEDWLTAKTSQLQTHAATADQQLRETVKGIHDATQQAFEGLTGQLRQGAAQTPGNVSDPSQASAFDISPEQTRALGLIANQQVGVEKGIAAQQQYRADEDAMNVTYMASLAAKRQADTWRGLTEVADDKQKLVLEKAADAAQEVSRLLDKETQKANANRDFEAVSSKLGFQRDELRSKQQQFLAELGIKKDRLKLDRGKAGESARHNRALENIRKESEAAKREMSQSRLDLDWYKARHPGSGRGAAGTGGSRQDNFEFAYAKLASSIRANGKRYNADYVGKRTDAMIAAVQSATKVSRDMAKRVVMAYITMNGKDPGNWQDWTHRGDDPKPKG